VLSFLSVLFILLPHVSYSSTTQTSILSEGFEPAIPSRSRQQTFSLDRSGTGIDMNGNYAIKDCNFGDVLHTVFHRLQIYSILFGPQEL
jgi:hypothetical protein